MENEVVITGIGVLSPIAVGREQYWQALKQGKKGFRKISLFDTSRFKVDIGGEITSFDPEQFLGKKGLRTMDRSTRLVCSAAKLALEDSDLEIKEENEHTIGVSIGATFGSLHSISQFDIEGLTDGPRYVNPSLFPNTVINSPASNISIRFGIKGFNTTISTGFCASLDSIMYASDFLRLNRADAVLAGGVEELCEETFMMFHELGFLAGTNGGALLSCPYDNRANGFILSEGASVLVLESKEHASGRKAKALAKVSGYGSSFESSNGNYLGSGKGLENAIMSALHFASLNAEDIDYICSFANSTKELDMIEAKTIIKIFGNQVPVSSIKSMIGESFSASGALAVSAAVGAMNMNFFPPNVNHQQSNKNFSLDIVSNIAKEAQVNTVLVLSSDPFGNNTALILGSPD
jgi:3-oxoacyl-[acyl-carrier-protein] synthase II